MHACRHYCGNGLSLSEGLPSPSNSISLLNSSREGSRRRVPLPDDSLLPCVMQHVPTCFREGNFAMYVYRGETQRTQAQKKPHDAEKGDPILHGPHSVAMQTDGHTAVKHIRRNSSPSRHSLTPQRNPRPKRNNKHHRSCLVQPLTMKPLCWVVQGTRYSVRVDLWGSRDTRGSVCHVWVCVTIPGPRSDLVPDRS